MSEEVRNAMANQGRHPRRSRWAAFGLATALLLALTGDGMGQGAMGLAGIDPLEVLDLKVKPNVGIVVDTSGSMRETVLGNGVRSDFNQSKMYLAKKVLNQVITDNQTEVNFLFATYKFSVLPSWNNCPGGNCIAPQGLLINGDMPGDGGRFQYSTESWAAVAPFGIEGPSPGMGAGTTTAVMNRLYAWQWIRGTAPVQNNLLRMSEAGVNCTATITPGFYNATTIVAAIKVAMEACGASTNTYTVTYNTGSGVFTITRATGTGTISLLWTDPITTFDGPTRMTANQTGATTYNTNDARINLLQRVAGDAFTENKDPDGTGPSPARNVTAYYLYAQKLWNGEIIQVDGAGLACNILPGTPTSPDPTVTLQRVSSCGTPTVVSTNVFTWAGGVFNANSASCQPGFDQRVPLFRCDASPANVQSAAISPFLQNELPLSGTGGLTGYVESADGTGTIVTSPAGGGVVAQSGTPMAQSFDGFRWKFGGYPGVAPVPAAPYVPSPLPATSGLWQAGQSLPFPNNTTAISTHPDPKERTILLMVTDGDQNCAPFGGVSDVSTWGAAMAAQRLYDPAANGTGAGTVNADGTITGDIASSVTTYVIGFGNGGQVNRLNWIAWGGSGMKRSGGNVGTTSGVPTWTNIPSAAERVACKTCQDAFIAPDAQTLAAQLQAIIDQGPNTGEFTAQQAVFTTVYELVREVTPGSPAVAPAVDDFDPEAPSTRYAGTVPNLFRSTFAMPGFKGQFRSIQNDGTGLPVVNWNAGQKLYDRVNNALASCNEGGGGLLGECRFASLLARIDRRIYTTSGNGAFPATVANLTDDNWLSTNGNRALLWPSSTTIAPQNDTAVGFLDIALGLPATVDTDATNATFNSLQTAYGACSGSNLAAACTAGLPAKTQRARREARERILAYMAGAQVVSDALGFPKHISSGANLGSILYQRRDWVLADSTLATPAVVGPPIEPEPVNSGFEAEYVLFRDGFRDAANDSTGDGSRIGFGLRNPDKDKDFLTLAQNGPAPGVKPVMTVAYLAANDMLHAFRAGPNCSLPPYTGAGCNERGGEELWGFVPYDQLDKLRQQLVVQTRANHTYMLAASLRFGDVFVPNPGTTSDPSGATASITVGAKTESVQGVWRRILFFGRGIGGKFLTALDITSPGEYKTLAANTVPPVVLWNRGNPDTLDPEYAEMGQTWSTPALSYVDRAPHTTNRKPAGVDFVLHVGSGYGDTTGCPSSTPCEGQTFFTLDALTGDVIAAARVPASAGTPDGSYANSLVANPTAFNPNEFSFRFLPASDPNSKSGASNPAGRLNASAPKVERVYIGDLHGRLWKILTSAPATPLLVTDLGLEQPIATAVSIVGFEEPSGSGTIVPYVYVTSGNDRRQDPNSSGEAFVLAGIKDDAPSALTPTDACKQSPVVAPCLFAREMTQVVSGVTGYFRGTVQPTAFLSSNTPPLGRVFFAGTRFNPPAPLGLPFAPPPEPCKSSFDSIVYALGAKTGDAAFDLNADPNADDAYVILDNSKLVGIYLVSAPGAAGQPAQTQLMLDEGLNRAVGGGGGAGTNCTNGEGPDCIPGGGEAPGSTTPSTGGVLTTGYRPSSTICQ